MRKWEISERDIEGQAVSHVAERDRERTEITALMRLRDEIKRPAKSWI